MNFFQNDKEATEALYTNFTLLARRIQKRDPAYVPTGYERLAIKYLLSAAANCPCGRTHWESAVTLRPAVYPAGKIAGQTDSGCNDWRAVVKASLEDTFDILDPMVRDMRGVHMTPEQDQWLIKMDKADIASCFAVVFRADDGPSWGTAMEMHYGSTLLNHHNIVFTGGGSTSPWVRAHADCLVRTVEEACEEVRARWKRQETLNNLAVATGGDGFSAGAQDVLDAFP
jgi:hypothetical protein